MGRTLALCCLSWQETMAKTLVEDFNFLWLLLSMLLCIPVAATEETAVNKMGS